MDASYSGFVTRKELAASLNISVETLRLMMKPYQHLLVKSGKRKRLYYPGEAAMIRELLKQPKAL